MCQVTIFHAVWGPTHAPRTARVVVWQPALAFVIFTILVFLSLFFIIRTFSHHPPLQLLPFPSCLLPQLSHRQVRLLFLIVLRALSEHKSGYLFAAVLFVLHYWDKSNGVFKDLVSVTCSIKSLVLPPNFKTWPTRNLMYVLGGILFLLTMVPCVLPRSWM